MRLRTTTLTTKALVAMDCISVPRRPSPPTVRQVDPTQREHAVYLVLNRVVIGNRSHTPCDRRPLRRPKSNAATNFLSPVGLSEGWRYSTNRIALCEGRSELNRTTARYENAKLKRRRPGSGKLPTGMSNKSSIKPDRVVSFNVTTEQHLLVSVAVLDTLHAFAC